MEEQEVKEVKTLEEEERERKRHLIIIIILLFIAILALTVAFTRITSELSGGGDIINPPTPPIIPVTPQWDVGFVKTESSGVATGSERARTNCGTITTTEFSATISNVTLPSVNNRCSYPLTIENKGTIDAKIQEIVLTAPTGVNCKIEGSRMTCGNITYKISTNQNGTDLLSEGAELNIESQILAYLIVETSGTNTNFNSTSQSGAKITVVYAEK